MNVSTQDEVWRWRPAGFLRVTGADAFAFLQGQFTNDLRLLSDRGSVYGLWLNVKGKVLADSFVVRGAADAVWVASYFCAASTIRARLESHIIADDVTLDDQTPGYRSVTLFGSNASAQAQVVTEALRGSEVISFPGRRCREEHVEVMFPVTGEAIAHGALSEFRLIDDEEIARRRIRAGIAAVPADIGPNDLPNEGGLDADAISYTKGCYLGQEVMARLKSMGQVRRRLLRVRGGAQAIPAIPAPLFAAERQVGELRSIAIEPDGSIVGLAMLSLLHLNPPSELAWGAGAKPTLQLADQP